MIIDSVTILEISGSTTAIASFLKAVHTSIIDFRNMRHG
jgi:hypothetical protein